MLYTRRDIGRLALMVWPAAPLVEGPFGALAQTRKPNSVIAGVSIGTITYSYRSMPDQSAEATLRYVVESGISQIELMNGPAESFAGAPQGARGGGGGRRGQPPTPEQQAAQRESADKLKQWRTSVSMDRFKQLRRMYDDAGVKIYAWKALNPNMSDEEFDYVFNVAEALGCTHTTLELPTEVAQLKRIGAFAEKRKIYAAYHTHLQASMTAFDQAFAASKANMSNVDLGHYVAGTGESPIPFLRKFHGRIASVHLKDRQTPAHGAGNLPWGTGDTPLKEILQLMKQEKYAFPASIEFEYDVPAGSTAVREVAKCLDYCRAAL
ncbi:MAG TPA: sugar phosphate isomerase/epimerase [Vicinamibacterales bacterium]|nr:sugar phosphate isomerase/epimerase [Vicinamibacterales bacterium]